MQFLLVALVTCTHEFINDYELPSYMADIGLFICRCRLSAETVTQRVSDRKLMQSLLQDFPQEVGIEIHFVAGPFSVESLKS